MSGSIRTDPDFHLYPSVNSNGCNQKRELTMKKRNQMSGVLGERSKILLLISLGLVIMILAGCDEKDSYEARFEDAKIALDDGNYAVAKAILVELPQTAEVKEALSSVIAGGDLNLNMFNIILTMDSLEEDGDTGSVDMIGLLIGGDTAYISGDAITAKLLAATEAIELYKDIAEMKGLGVDGLANEQKLQLGLLCITRTVLTIGSLISDELPAGASITLTESWIKANRSYFPTVNPSTGDLDRIGEDLLFIGYSISSLGESNDMKDDYEGFQNELDANSDNMMTSLELNTYIDNM